MEYFAFMYFRPTTTTDADDEESKARAVRIIFYMAIAILNFHTNHQWSGHTNAQLWLICFGLFFPSFPVFLPIPFSLLQAFKSHFSLFQFAFLIPLYLPNERGVVSKHILCSNGHKRSRKKYPIESDHHFYHRFVVGFTSLKVVGNMVIPDERQI